MAIPDAFINFITFSELGTPKKNLLPAAVYLLSANWKVLLAAILPEILRKSELTQAERQTTATSQLQEHTFSSV